jgi:hypothetical protein
MYYLYGYLGSSRELPPRELTILLLVHASVYVTRDVLNVTVDSTTYR